MGTNGDTPTQVEWTRLPISLPCPVMVVPGTPFTQDEDGNVLPGSLRTEQCNVDAHWMLGAAVCCDVHARQAAELLAIDFDELVEHFGQCECEKKPWTERRRYEQKGLKL